jgi:hypothetical protein
MNKDRYDIISAAEAAKITNQIFEDNNLINETLKNLSDLISKTAYKGINSCETSTPKKSIYEEVYNILVSRGYVVRKTTPVVNCEVWVIEWNTKI